MIRGRFTMEDNVHSLWSKQMKFRKQPVHLCSQVCVSRNLEGYPFPGQASEGQRNAVVERIQDAFKHCRLSPEGVEVVMWRDLEPQEKRVFQALYALEDPCNETILWLLPKDNAQIIINDSDHLRFQCKSTRAHLYSTLQTLLAMETLLENHLAYVFDPLQGYPTSKPQNCGTGIRIRQELHLPGLCFMQQLSRVKSSAAEMDLSFEPIKVVNDKILGHLFTLSTATGLGLSEKELVEHVEHVCQLIVQEEERIRRDLWTNNTLFLKDSISRALGLLDHCYELTYEEAVNLFSIILMAMDTGIIPTYKRSALLTLWHAMPSDFLSLYCQRALRPEEVSAHRAQCVHAFFKAYSNPFEKKLEEVYHVA